MKIESIENRWIIQNCPSLLNVSATVPVKMSSALVVLIDSVHDDVFHLGNQSPVVPPHVSMTVAAMLELVAIVLALLPAEVLLLT